MKLTIMNQLTISDENIYEIETFFKNHFNKMYCIQQMETHDKSRKI